MSSLSAFLKQRKKNGGVSFIEKFCPCGNRPLPGCGTNNAYEAMQRVLRRLPGTALYRAGKASALPEVTIARPRRGRAPCVRAEDERRLSAQRTSAVCPRRGRAPSARAEDERRLPAQRTSAVRPYGNEFPAAGRSAGHVHRRAAKKEV